MKKIIFLLASLFVFQASALEVTKSKFTAYVSTWDGKIQLAQNIYLDISKLNKKLKTERLEDYSGLYKFELRKDTVVLILQKENKEYDFGEIDSGLIDVNRNDRVQVKSITALKTRLIKFKKGIPLPRWSWGCGITGCDVDFDWKRSRKLLVEIETLDGSILCLAKGYKNRLELKSGRCN